MARQFLPVIVKAKDPCQGLLPKQFCRKHKSMLSSDTLLLQTLSGDEWEVEVERSHAGLKLEWQDFYVENKLSAEQPLLFVLEANCRFKVYIFDRDGCVLTSLAEKPKKRRRLSVQIKPLEETHQVSTGEELVVPDSEDEGRQREVEYTPEVQAFEEPLVQTFQEPFLLEARDCYVTKTISNSPAASDDQKEQKELEKLERSNRLKSTRIAFYAAWTVKKKLKNPCYVKDIRRHHFTSFQMTFDERLRKSMPRYVKSVRLKNQQGKAWTVRLLSHKLGSGWNTFSKENGLKCGDVCLFELVESRTLKVHIYRKRDYEEGRRQRLK